MTTEHAEALELWEIERSVATKVWERHDLRWNKPKWIFGFVMGAATCGRCKRRWNLCVYSNGTVNIEAPTGPAMNRRCEPVLAPPT